MKFRHLLAALIAITVFSCTEDEDENVPAQVTILFPKEGQTYYQGQIADYLIVDLEDTDQNVSKIRMIGNSNVQEFDFTRFAYDFDLYDTTPDTLRSLSHVLGMAAENSRAVTIEVDEGGQDVVRSTVTFNLIPDVVELSNSKIENIEVVDQWSNRVRADISFDLETESGDLSTILYIAFHRSPGVRLDQFDYLLPLLKYDGVHNPPLSNSSYQTTIETTQNGSDLYAYVFVKSVVQNAIDKFYVFKVGEL